MEDEEETSISKMESEMDSLSLKSTDDDEPAEAVELDQEDDDDVDDREFCMNLKNDDVSLLREKIDISDDWKETINKIVPAVVVLRVTASRAFDTQLPSSGSATGFIVDKQRGIILTNRHVVKPGPVVAQAIFANHEEIPVYPIYRDPVHDFGFFRYDPNGIRFLEYEEIALAPEAACVGLDIRVVGNDSDEKVSILAGTIARLDRDAPEYKWGGYNDFNTFYIQAASGSRFGSSGSPVIDRQGRAVALNSGGCLFSSPAFFLPLERVVRALRIIQKCRDSNTSEWEAANIPRGTLQVTFKYKGFEKARQLGLRSEIEKMVRHASAPGETGMLVVHSVVPGGPAHKQLETGDVLVCVNGEVTTRFLKLEMLLDEGVGQKIELQIERGNIPLTVNLEVHDLHSITPDHFLEVSGSVIHPLSYQQARNFRFQCGLVYVADPGYMLCRAGVPRHAIIKKFADAKISKLEDFVSVLSKLSRGAQAILEYKTHKDHHQRKSAVVTIDRHEWHDTPKIYTRDDGSGFWSAKPAIQPKSPLLSSCISVIDQDLEGDTSAISSESSLVKHSPQTKGLESTHSAASLEGSINHASEVCSRNKYGVQINTQSLAALSGNEISTCEIGDRLKNSAILESENFSSYGDSGEAVSDTSFPERLIERSLVMVQVHVSPSCYLDGVHSRHFSGTGIVVHHSPGMGLVAVDRNTVAISASDVMLSFAAYPIEIPAEVVFLHPVYNYAFVAYDPFALGASGASMVRAAELHPEPALCRGDVVYLVGLRSLQTKSRKSTVTNSCLSYRNMEVIQLDSDFGSTFTGVLSNERGQVQAFWARFSTKLKSRGRTSKFVRGIPIYMINDVLNKIISGVGANGPSLLINGVKRPMPLVRVLEAELKPRSLSKARFFGLSDDWIQALVNKDPIRRQVLRVSNNNCVARRSKAKTQLKKGDMVLAVNKEPVTCFSDIKNACKALENCGDNDAKLNMTVFRKGHEVDLLVGVNTRDGNGTTRMISWCGCILQYPHAAVLSRGFLPDEGHGVYVGRCYPGSPAHRYGLRMLRWIVEINGKLTPDLDTFVTVIKELGCEEFVRIKTVSLTGRTEVITLKQDLHYWPTWELRFDPDTAMWCRQTINALQ